MRRDINEDLFELLTTEVIKNKKDISNFADRDGRICLVKARNKSLYWIMNGNVAESHDGKLNLANSDISLIGRHIETLRCIFLSRTDILQIIGKTTINEFAEELRELYYEQTGKDGKESERKQSRALFLRYYREIKNAYKKLEIQDSEDFFSYAKRISQDKANCYIKKYHDILYEGMQLIGEISAICILTDNENERRIYEKTIDRIVNETLTRMP